LLSGGLRAGEVSTPLLTGDPYRKYKPVLQFRSGKTFEKQQKLENPKKNLTVRRMIHNILTGHGDVDVAVDFTNTHTFARVYNKELQWLLLS